MLALRILLSRILLTLVLALFVVSCDGGKNSGDGKQLRVILPAGETHEGWYFAHGDQVIIEGTVNGDAYVAGGQVQVDGTINGDLIVAGGQIIITGKVSDDVRAAGGSVESSGLVGKNLTVAGGNIRVGKGSEVGGGLLAAGGNVFVGGTVEHHALVAAGAMSISGTIGGNVDFSGGTLDVLTGSTVGGNVRALVSDTQRVEIASGVVRGTVDVSTHEPSSAHAGPGSRPWRFWLRIIWTLGLVATILVFVLLFPKQTSDVGGAILQHPGKSLLVGIIGLIIIPVVVLLLFITLIGIPVGLLVLMVYLSILYLSQLCLGAALGRRLYGGQDRWRLFGALAIGILIVELLTLVPYVRTIVLLAGLLFGIGAILLVLKREYDMWGKGERNSPAPSVAPV